MPSTKRRWHTALLQVGGYFDSDNWARPATVCQRNSSPDSRKGIHFFGKRFMTIRDTFANRSTSLKRLCVVRSLSSSAVKRIYTPMVDDEGETKLYEFDVCHFLLFCRNLRRSRRRPNLSVHSRQRRLV